MRVVLAMSGGVDSSAAAKLLLEQGYDVVGLFMRSGATEETVCATKNDNDLPVISAKSHKQGCCSASDAADARRVADSLDIPFHALNFSEAFGRIKDYFADEYLAGRTPNPCVMCNNWLKFGKLWDFAQQVGAERIASGHYARLVRRVESGELRVESSDESGKRKAECGKQDGDRVHRTPLTTHHSPLSTLNSQLSTLNSQLFRGKDRNKDQSYVLFGINRDLLDRILFPVGDFDKPAIRDLARETGLRVADKPDSQEICFIPDNDYAGFIARYRDVHETAGDVVDTAGTVLGRHDGFERFTIGQRRGLGIAFGSPRYVVAIEPESRRVVIGEKEHLACDTLEADRLNWLVDGLPSRFTCHAQIRYRHDAAEAEAIIVDENRLRVRFTAPQFGVTPGQAVVLYDGDRVLGGGWIRGRADRSCETASGGSVNS